MISTCTGLRSYRPASGALHCRERWHNRCTVPLYIWLVVSLILPVHPPPDGEPTGEPPGTVVNVIKGAKNLVSNSQYGPGAVAFEFAQVGKARP